MKKFFSFIMMLLESAGRARAAAALTRSGRWKEAQQLMSK
jgi:hypothetical protein